MLYAAAVKLFSMTRALLTYKQMYGYFPNQKTNPKTAYDKVQLAILAVIAGFM